jgi:hypothetical protein
MIRKARARGGQLVDSGLGRRRARGVGQLVTVTQNAEQTAVPCSICIDICASARCTAVGTSFGLGIVAFLYKYKAQKASPKKRQARARSLRRIDTGMGVGRSGSGSGSEGEGR